MNRDRRAFLIALGATGAVSAGLGALAATWLRAESAPSAQASPAGSRRIRLATLDTQFGDVAAVPSWSPTGDAICVQQVRGGERFVTVYEAASWSMRFSAAGSLPAWAPNGMALAVVDPFPRSTPPTDSTAVRVLDARTGVEQRRVPALTASVGWSSQGLRVAIGGDLRALDPGPGPSASSCGGACEIGIWSALAEYALTADGSQPSNYSVRDGISGKTLASLGNARGASAWASASPTLVGSFALGPLRWHPKDGVQLLGALPEGYQPVVAAPGGDVVLSARMTAGRLEWLQLAIAEGRVAEIALPLASTRAVTWDPSGRYLTSIPSSFGLAMQLEVFKLDFEP